MRAAVNYALFEGQGILILRQRSSPTHNSSHRPESSEPKTGPDPIQGIASLLITLTQQLFATLQWPYSDESYRWYQLGSLNRVHLNLNAVEYPEELAWFNPQRSGRLDLSMQR